MFHDISFINNYIYILYNYIYTGITRNFIILLNNYVNQFYYFRVISIDFVFRKTIRKTFYTAHSMDRTRSPIFVQRR